MSLWTRYGKTIAAGVIAVAMAAWAQYTQGHTNPAELIRILIAAAAVAAVYLAPVVPRYPWIKTALAVVMAILNVLVALILDGIQLSDWVAVLFAVATALGVGVAPAVSETRPPTPAQP